VSAIREDITIIKWFLQPGMSLSNENIAHSECVTAIMVLGRKAC